MRDARDLQHLLSTVAWTAVGLVVATAVIGGVLGLGLP